MIEKLYRDIKHIIDTALPEVIPDKAVKRALQDYEKPAGRTVIIAVGKAAWQMAKSAAEAVPDYDCGLVITRYGHLNGPLARFEMFEAGHPLTDENSFRAARRALEVADGLTRDDTVIFLVSGGASAIFEYSELPVTRLQEISDILIKGGADITAINAVRKRLSLVKGGRFAQRCRPARVLNLILSDVINGAPDTVGSGPGCPDTSSEELARETVRKYNLDVELQPTCRQLDNVTTKIIGDNRLLADAAAEAARQLGYETEIVSTSLCGNAEEEGHKLAELANKAKGKKAFIGSGEPLVEVIGTGRGGRAQQLVLATLEEIKGRNIALASLGSDGKDGASDAAGGYVDGTTVYALPDWHDYLLNNDAHNALLKTGGLIYTGPTGTNVNDLMIVLTQGDNMEEKKSYYEPLPAQMAALCEGQKYLMTVLANSSALLKQVMPDLNWAGYYIKHGDKLLLGPFQGLPACEVIAMGNGVCGTSAARRETVVVPNVHEFPGHIACDSASNSEIVIPLFVNGEVWGVLDIDSPIFERFDETDRYYLEKTARIIEQAVSNCL